MFYPPNSLNEKLLENQWVDLGIDWGMVPVEGLEPPTFGLQNRCSTN
jgi:hypothetical protein